ncbi:MAG: DUF3486 family protein [Treponema sp.]|nr:DUF3486 family protein [Treponema sp.]
MPKRNKIEMQGLVERIVDMFYEQKMSQADIAAALKAEGYDVSKSGVGRTLISHASQMKAYRDAAKESAEIIRALRNTPGMDISEATVQLVQTKLLNEVKKFGDLSTLDVKDVLKLVGQTSAAQARIAKVKLDYEKGYRQGLFRAAEIVEKEGRKAGLSEETLQEIKSKISGEELPTALAAAEGGAE